jgi:pimeloyl-ACP methyl ester carboxylesterase
MNLCRVGAAARAALVLAVCPNLSSTKALAATKSGSDHDARSAIAAAQAVAPGGIDELKAVEIGGIKQWISVRGNNKDNPILLFLHGGPGSPMMPESWTFQRPWEDFFTVVQWDQRGAGKTLSAAGRKVDQSMSIGRMQADTEELIQFLLKSYEKKKLFLLGHSWGSVLGVRVAQHRPEWLYAYIGIGQVVNMRRNEAVGYEMTLAHAEEVGNESAIKELKSIAPYPNSDGSIPLLKTLTERKWDIAFGGLVYGSGATDGPKRRALSSEYSDYDDKSAELGESSSLQILWPEVTAVNFDAVAAFECPVFFFAGSHDWTTPASLVEEFYKHIQAPEKKLFKIDRAAHYVVNEAPGEVLMHLVDEVRPLYQNMGD